MASEAVYDIGDLVTLTGTFTDASGVDTDPTAVTLQVKEPDGTLTTVSNTKSTTGVYSGTFAPTMAGVHYYRFAGTGTLQAAGEDAFRVREQKVQ